MEPLLLGDMFLIIYTPTFVSNCDVSLQFALDGCNVFTLVTRKP